MEVLQEDEMTSPPSAVKEPPRHNRMASAPVVLGEET